MKNLKENWAIILLCALALYIMYISSNKAEKAQEEVEKYKMEIDSIQKINDSLHSELFPTQIELSRHQLAYKIFLSRNPRAAQEYGNIISEETE